MKVFWILWVIGGGGFGSVSWGGPSMLRFESATECETVLEKLKEDASDFVTGMCLKIEPK